MDADKLTVTMTPRHGERLYIFGPTKHERMWLEPRKWWQFWRPRYVEKYTAWEEWSGPKDAPKDAPTVEVRP